MTFGLVLGNADQIIQINDRRITAGNRMVDDSVSKSGYAICDDASFLYCFTGLAKAGSHVTSLWLPDALYEAAQRGHTYPEIVHNMAQMAHAFFNSSPVLKRLSARDRRITIMLTGYLADGHIANSLISNFQDFINYVDLPEARDEFEYYSERSNYPAEGNPTIIQAIGQFHAFTASDEKQLREMLEQRKPAEAIRQKAISLVQEIADRPNVNGTVGKKISTARLNRLDPLVPVSGYASDEVETEIHLLDMVNLCSGAPKLIIANAKAQAESAMVFPQVHRNAPCPCGSGKKYRFCHRA